MSHSRRPWIPLVVAGFATLLLSSVAPACGGQTSGSGDGSGGGTGPRSDGGSPGSGDEAGHGGGGECDIEEIIPPVITLVDATTGKPICDAFLVNNDGGSDNLSPYSCASGTSCDPTTCRYAVQAYGNGDTFSVTVSAPGYDSAVVNGLTTSYCGCDPSGCASPQMKTVTLVPAGDLDAGPPPFDATGPIQDGGPAPPDSGAEGCPASEPVSGSVACGSSSLECEYGTNASASCNDLYTCQGGVWQNVTDKTACAAPATCPASYGAATGSCNVTDQTCQYGGGTCICSPNPDGLPGVGGPGWACIPTTMGCPVDRPELGSPCPNGSPGDCDYGQCIGGIGETCANGFWVQANTACPG